MENIYSKRLTRSSIIIGGCMFLMCMSNQVMAQRTIQGTITDATDGSPLIGASVLIKSTANGTIADTEGRYTLQVNDGDVLVVSFIGYNTEEVPVGDRTTIDVVLSVSSTSLRSEEHTSELHSRVQIVCRPLLRQ